MIPAGIVDPFTYIETGDRRVATVSVLDASANVLVRTSFDAWGGR